VWLSKLVSRLSRLLFSCGGFNRLGWFGKVIHHLLMAHHLGHGSAAVTRWVTKSQRDTRSAHAGKLRHAAHCGTRARTVVACVEDAVGVVQVLLLQRVVGSRVVQPEVLHITESCQQTPKARYTHALGQLQTCEDRRAGSKAEGRPAGRKR
jgi:hypothetical protein